MSGARKALIVATYEYADGGLRRLAAPEHDADSFASVLKDPAIAGFDVTMLANQPHYVVGEAIADFYGASRSDDLTLLYFTGHGLKDDEGRLYLAMTNTRRDALMFTAISGAQLNDAMDASRSRRKVLILDCCYSGSFPAGRTAKADESVQTLERFQGKGRAVLTASDATQYAFEGDDLRGTGSSSVFTRYLVEAISSGAADLDEDGDIALDELYSYVYEKVVAELPQQRPKKQEDVDGRILIARNVHWQLPAYLRHAIESPIAEQRLSAVAELGHLYRAGNDVVRSAVSAHVTTLAADDSRSVSAAAEALLERIGSGVGAGAPDQVKVPAPRPEPEPVLKAPTATSPAVPVLVPAPPPRTGPPPVLDPGPAPAAPPEEPPEPVPTAGPSTPPRVPPWRSADGLVLGLVVLSALPLTLYRLLYFEAGYPATADGYNESTVPWTMFVVLPLVAAAGLLVARRRLPWALPVGLGLVLGVSLVLVEHATFWAFFFVEFEGSYAAGPALWALLVGAAVVAAAGAVVLVRSPLRGGATVRTDWRVACAFVVAACLLWFLVSGPPADTVPWWVALYVGTLLLGAAALPITLLWLRSEQRVAALVAITIFGAWTAYFGIRELVDPQIGLEPSVARAHVICVVLTLLACVAAQTGPARVTSAGRSGQ